VSFNTRLLTSASASVLARFAVLALVVTPIVSVTPAAAFDLSGDEDDTEYTTTVKTGDTPSAGQSIILNGTPTDASQAGVLVNSNTDVTIDGAITLRDREVTDDTDVAYTLTGGVGIKVDVVRGAGSNLRLENGAAISIVEVRGAGYDSDEDGFADLDTDEDGILEGSPAVDGVNQRIGLWINNTIAEALIGESGSSITIEGNGDNGSNIVAGVLIGATLSNNLDLSTRISMFGDQARGVDIDAAITGDYRQRGDIDVRGEGGVGIDIGTAITGSLLIESLVNATGYSTAPTPQRGVDESELTADESNANANERRRGGSAIDVAANVSGGILINGSLNTIQTPSETQALADIAEARTDDDGNLVDITAQKTLPFHFDANRASGRVTTYGEASGEAALKISSTIGSLTGSTLETFLDTTNDDGEAVPEEDTDPQLDVYDSTREFFYSHGLMNRGTIAANSWYDGFKADAVRVEAGATIHGGIYNSGSISATAYNGDATALGLNAGALNDGLRSDSSILLNEGTISASVTTHTGSDSTKTKSSNTATAIVLADGVAPAGGLILNRGTIFASSNHITAATDDAAATSVVGEHAIALDVSAVTSALHITQSMRQADALLSSGANSNTNPYLNGGDLDIDRTGNIGENDDGNAINIADGKIDTRDIAAPSITGEIRFGSGANEFRLLAGTMTGNIDFAGGADDLFIGNSMEDDANSEDDFEDNEYTAPITSFSGTIENGASSDLTLTLGGQTAITAEKTRLHFIGQEGRDLNDDGDDGDLGEEFEGLDITSLTLSEKADLRFTIDPTFLSGAVLDVTNLTVGTDATISPFITRLPGLDADGNPEARVLTLIESSSDLSSLSSTINDNLLEDGHPYIYNVSLAVDETGTKDAIAATFALKEASELGLNKTEGAAWPAVISHFGTNETLEARLSAITDGDDFVAYYDQLLPQHGDGTMKQLASLGEAATGAVGQHLQIVAAGGRRDGDGWLQQFGDYRKQDGTVETDTVSGTSYGLAIGYDAPASFTEALGLYAQMSFTSVNEKPSLLPNGLAPNRNEVKAESFGVGAYLADALGPVRYELSAAAGSIAFDSVRGVQFNGLSDVLSAAWDGTSTSASARIIYPILEDDHLLRVEAGRDYFSLEQDDYTEQTAFLVDPELALRVRGGSSDMTSDYVGIRGSLVRGGGSPSDIVWEPNYYLGWRSVAEYSPYSAKANFVGNDTEFDLTSQDEISDSTELGLGLAAHNDYFAFEFNYRGKFGDGEEVHGGGISVRLLF
jgi:uncharacterized protein with beta-barrel porin domain